MKATSFMCTVGAVLSPLLLSAQVHAQESMTAEQLIQNGQGDNAFGAAMFIAGWATGTAQQLRLRAEDLRAAGAGSEQADYLDGLAECVARDIEVADLATTLRAALRDNKIDSRTFASTALNAAAIEICVSREND